MYNNKRILALIPARGGSKGIIGKNIYPLNGIPLISYTIREAIKSTYIDKCVVSTDDVKISDISRLENADIVIRPARLSQDHSKTIDVVIHTIVQYLCYDTLVLLQPTSPLRSATHIDRAIEEFFTTGEIPLCSISPVSDNPVLIRSIDNGNRLTKLMKSGSSVRRQDFANYYRVNGAIYIIRIRDISETTSFNDSPVGYPMPRVCSIDIDDRYDLLCAETIIKTQHDFYEMESQPKQEDKC
jgi:CMP-N-acetylneuraminic acid synthetase